MIKFSTPSKKVFLNFIIKFNTVLSDKLAHLTKKNFKQLFKDLISDRRFVITIIIILLSIFAHLSTPAFYQDKWVLSKIKKQLQNEFDIELVLPEEVRYSMFPIPSFYLKNVKISDNGDDIGIIHEMKLCLTFNKFLNREKINIQAIHIKNSKFEIYDKHLNDLKKFFDKKINNKKLKIKKSKIFFKDKTDDVYLIFNIDQSISYFNRQKLFNSLELKGDVFNVPLDLFLANNYLTKKLLINLDLNKINKKINLNLDYLKEINNGVLELSDKSLNHISNFEFNDNMMKISSSKLNDDNFLYQGFVKLKPFYSNLIIDVDNVSLLNLIDKEGLILGFLRSNILFNENLNYDIEINSKNLRDHRKLSDLNLYLNFNQKKLKLDNSKLIFDEEIIFKILDSEFVSNETEDYFSGEIQIEVNNSDKLYKYFQTNKKFRKRLDKINISFKYDYLNNSLDFKKINLNGMANNKINNFVESYNRNNIKSFKRVDIKNFFNSLVSTLD